MRALDVVSRWVITIGGIGTVAAVSTVLLLLLWVVAPLLRQATVGPPRRSPVPAAGAPLGFGVDDYLSIAWTLAPDGTLTAFRTGSGEVVHAAPVAPGRTVTAATFATGSTAAALGFSDGTIAFGTVGFRTEFLDAAAAPEALRALPVGGQARHGEGVAERVSETQIRTQRLEVAFGEPVPGASGAPVALLDRSFGGGETVAALHADGVFEAALITRRENLLTGEVTTVREELEPSWHAPAGEPAPMRLLLAERGDSATFVWPDGRLVRVPLGDGGVPERVSLLPPGAGRVTAAAWLLGRTTLLIGDDTGGVRAWFPARAIGPDGEPAGAPRLVAAHAFPGKGAAVTALATSSRSRIFVAGRADGSLEVWHVTSGKLLARLDASVDRDGVGAVAIAPKEDGLAAVAGGKFAAWDFSPRHPETTLASLFRPVWYEGASRPEHVWQSSAATDDFEPKLGLVPLVFGTLKATVYSLVFGVPVALLAAIFTSEFLAPRLRMRVKPVVELMASLPSVVLGFLAALVIAPVAADHLGAVLAVVLTGPLAFLVGAYLWQLLPARAALRLAPWRFPAMFLAVPAALAGAAALGPLVERAVFGGSLAAWLAGGDGSLAGAWACLLAPLAALALVPAWGLVVTPRARAAARDCTRLRCGLLDLGLFAGGLAAVAATATIGGAALAALGADPRGGLVGTYVQRNSLVVGFIMGFAIIPIVYTIAEDALAAVPEHLRSASLASGATPWQTAWRIVIPTAMSGLFSAVMIGLGRAVGETMIVLMAAGNTPIMEWNVFNGFRTLSANIAVELPEAVRNSTHYRTLFLAALVLFAMTFLLNTAAELVRIRFRRKASAL